MKNSWTAAGAFAGFLGVAIGASGAHMLRGYIVPGLEDTFHTGVLYHLIHAVVITSIGLNGKKEYGLPAFFFALGILLFSFSLYAYALSGIKSIAIITPFGGLSFLAGWVILAVISLKKRQN